VKSRSVFLCSVILIVLSIPCECLSEIGIGTGYSGVTHGRPIPLIYLSIGTSRIVFTASSTGVKTSLYYHSAWQAHLFFNRNMGDLWWGRVDLGLGWGAFASKKAYREDTSSEEDRKYDFLTGPAFRITWEIMNPFFIAVETLYGLDNPFYHLMLAFRFQGTAIMGVRF